jgi:hypothetical protein
VLTCVSFLFAHTRLMCSSCSRTDEFFFAPPDDLLDGGAAGLVPSHNSGFVPSKPGRALDAPPPQRVVSKKDDDAYWTARQQRQESKLLQPKKRWHAGSKMRLKKNQKAAVFLEWLVKTYDLEQRGRGYACMQCGLDVASSSTSLFDSGFHVVDVAGGRGQLAFYLAAFYTVPVSVIDPVVMNLARFEVQFAKKQAAVKRMQLATMAKTDATSTSSSSVSTAPDSASATALSSSCILCSRSTPPQSNSSSASPTATSFEQTSSPAAQPVPWLSHLRHYQCMFPSSIALSVHKNHRQSRFIVRSIVARAAPPSSSIARVAHTCVRSVCFSFSGRPASKSTDGDETASDDDDECIDCDEQAGAEFSSPLRSPSRSDDANASLSAALASTLSSCSLLYGMHSDGATEALVDYALEHDKDFAVVPCCVFPSAAPHRRVQRSTVQRQTRDKQQSRHTDSAAPLPCDDTYADGDWVAVRTYEEFLAYLLAKHPSIQRVDLGFEGRNTVLYRCRAR